MVANERSRTPSPSAQPAPASQPPDPAHESAQPSRPTRPIPLPGFPSPGQATSAPHREALRFPCAPPFTPPCHRLAVLRDRPVAVSTRPVGGAGSLQRSGGHCCWPLPGRVSCMPTMPFHPRGPNQLPPHSTSHRRSRGGAMAVRNPGSSSPRPERSRRSPLLAPCPRGTTKPTEEADHRSLGTRSTTRSTSLPTKRHMTRCCAIRRGLRPGSPAGRA